MAPGGLTADGLRFAVDEKVIVGGVTLAVAPGRTLAIIGPSGCGKTTLLRLIAGIERAQAGTLRFDGQDLAGVPAHRRGFGMVFQDFALFPHLNVGRNVAFGLRRRGGGAEDDTKRRVAELLSTVGLEGFEHRRVGSLSGGEQQRVALARALAPRPRLLMLDEPLGSLDRGLREHLLLELKEILTDLDIPAIYVTHDQFEAFAIADRLAVMRAGRFVQEGTPRDVYSEPGTEFVARFLGFENIVDGVSDGTVVHTAVGEFCVRARPGAVRLLLRDEGVAIAEAGETGAATGVHSAMAFQGSMVRVEVATAEGKLWFSLPAATALPPIGGKMAFRVPSVQVIDAG